MASLLESYKDKTLKTMKAAMIPAASNLSALVGKNVTLEPSEVLEVPWIELARDTERYLHVRYQLEGELEGFQVFLFKEKDASVMTDLMVGGTGATPPEELDDLHLSAATESMGQMLESMVSFLRTASGKKIVCSSPEIKVSTLSEFSSAISSLVGGDNGVKIVYKLAVEGLVEGEAMQIVSTEFIKDLADLPEVSAAPERGEKSTVIVGAPGTASQGTPVVQPVQFAGLSAKPPLSREMGNIDLLMDVSLRLTVELGRTRKYVKDILALGSGSVVQLEKLAGEPVDVLVNEKLIAKGEVVVINENFGVRITEIVSPHERIESIR